MYGVEAKSTEHLKLSVEAIATGDILGAVALSGLEGKDLSFSGTIN